MPATDCLPQLRFGFHPQRHLDLDFEAPHSSSDGGLLLLRQLDERLGFLPRLAALLPDARQQAKVVHSRLEQLRQRVLMIACGYTDQNDAASLRLDPLFRSACDRSLDDSKGLSSQSALSRLEHLVSANDVVALQRAFEDDYVASLPDDTTELVLDLDATDDPTHGQQQLSFFNRHYDQHIYFPLLVFDHEGRLASVRLRAGNAGNNKYSCALIVRLVRKLKERFPSLLVCLRADSGFCNPRLLDALDQLHAEQGDVFYVLGVEKNPTLCRLAEDALARAKEESERTGKAARRYTGVPYQAGTWSRERAVLVKAEHLLDKANPRFVVTNLTHVSERVLYEQGYCGRGECENRIKDFKNAVGGDRLSDTTFVANAFRLLLHACAYRLLDGLRRVVAEVSPAQGRVQLDTLRERVVKVAAVVRQSVRRVVVSLPQTYPLAVLWSAVAQRVGGVERKVAAAMRAQATAETA
ncbi:MAG: IS1380 family transposase [Sorangiineae bacterium PRO1]|nr:IS1380 family transposase [Sorangiineae bacterium PRO1]